MGSYAASSGDSHSSVTTGLHGLPWYTRLATSPWVTGLLLVLGVLSAFLIFQAENGGGVPLVVGRVAVIATGLLGFAKMGAETATKRRLDYEARRSVASVAHRLTRVTAGLGRHGSGTWSDVAHEGFRQSVADQLKDIFEDSTPGRPFRVLLYQLRMAEATDPSSSDQAPTEVLRLVGCAVHDGSQPPDQLTEADAAEAGFPDIFRCLRGGGQIVEKRSEPPADARWKSAVYVRVSAPREDPDGELHPAWGTIHVDSPTGGKWGRERYYHNLLTLAASLLSAAAAHADTQITRADQRQGMSDVARSLASVGGLSLSAAADDSRGKE